MGSHYIPVGKIKIDKDILDIVCPAAGYDNTPPPPEIYCPVAGYIPDPTIYHEDPIITDAPKPGPNQIRLIVTDSGSRHVQFKCTVSNTGKYTVTVTGADDVVIETQTKNNNTVCQVIVPLLEGYLADGYSYYYIDIAPELEGNDLTLFQQTVNTTYDPQGGYVIAAIFNTPEILSLEKAFLNMKRIKYVEFVSNANALTTLLEAFNASENLEKIIFPAEMNALITINKMCLNTPNLKEVNLHEVSMNVLENMEYFMSLSGIKNFKFPKNIDSVLTMNYGFQNSKILENITLFESAENLQYIDYLFDGCDNLKGKIYYPEMPELISFIFIHRNNLNVEEVKFLGDYENETIVCTLSSFFLNCKKIKVIQMPAVGSFPSPANSDIIENCEMLETFILPKKWIRTRTLTATQAAFKGFLTNTKLSYVSAIEELVTDSPSKYFTRLLALKNNSLITNFHNPKMTVGKLDSGANNGEVDFSPLVGVSEIKNVRIDFKNSDLNYFKINNTKFTVENFLSIVSEYRRPKTITILKVANTPIENNLYEVQGRMNNNFFQTITSGNIPSVGDSFNWVYGTESYFRFNNEVGFNPSTGFINVLNLARGRNDVKFFFFSNTLDEASLPIVFFKDYYIVNCNITGTEFQISDTLGGNPILLPDIDYAGLQMHIDNKVLSVNGNVIELQHGSSNSILFSSLWSSVYDFYEMRKNGWTLYQYK